MTRDGPFSQHVMDFFRHDLDRRPHMLATGQFGKPNTVHLKPKHRVGLEMNRVGFGMNRVGFGMDRVGFEMNRVGFWMNRVGFWMNRVGTWSKAPWEHGPRRLGTSPKTRCETVQRVLEKWSIIGHFKTITYTQMNLPPVIRSDIFRSFA